MAENTKIQWCDHTFNTHWGCTKISDGCSNCYAENMGNRFGVKWGAGEPRKTMSENYWKQPLKWNKRAGENNVRERVFCSSMADVFDNEAPEGVREKLWSLIKATPHLDWLIVTKRIGNVKNMLPEDWGDGYPNVWLLITVVNQIEADRDIPKLIDTPAAIRGLSIEPMLGYIDLTYIQFDAFTTMDVLSGNGLSTISVCQSAPNAFCDPIDWVIVGGESGSNARPMHPAWAKSLQDQCKLAGVAFFFKQQGEWALEQVKAGGDLGGDMRKGIVQQVCLDRENDGHFRKGDVHMRKVGKEVSGRLLNGVEYNEYPNT